MTDPNIRTGFAIIGSFEAVYEAMFGPQQHNAHVAARRRELFLRRYAGNFDARMAEIMTEGRRLAALNQPKPQYLEAAE